MIDNPVHSLTFGDLVWVEEGANPPDSSGVVYRVRPEDATLGVPVPITTALMWLGRAGGPVSYDRTENREPVFRITVEADDSNLLARGEMALQLQCEQPTLLTWTPPDGASPPSVFEVVWSHLEPVFDRDGLTGLGMEETVARTRTYLVRMQALPYARGADLVVTPATSPTPTYTLVDNAAALSGAGFTWTKISGAAYTLTIVSSNIRVTKTPGSGFLAQLVRTGIIGLTASGPYLVFDLANAVNLSVTEFSIGHPLVTTVDLGGGSTRYFFYVGDVDVSTISPIRILATAPAPASPSSVDIVQVQMADAVPFIGTARQKAMSLVPGGSVRTQGSIHVTHATSALGKVLVYTHPSGTGYLPPLRSLRLSGNTVSTDTTLVSGAREPIGPSATIFRIPVSVLPTGRAEIWAWLRVTTGSLTRAPAYAVTSEMNGVILASSGGNFPITFTTVNVWQLFCLGAVTSPPIGLGPSGYIQIGLNENSGEVQIDEAYIFATDQGSLTVVDCGTGTASVGGPSKHLWIDAPSLEEPMGAIYRGHSADRSDAWHAGGSATPWGTHDFAPEGTSVFVVTQTALDAETSLEHYRRYGTYVTRED